jgi:tetratricopeptide (TPR) repeat protein
MTGQWFEADTQQKNDCFRAGEEVNNEDEKTDSIVEEEQATKRSRDTGVVTLRHRRLSSRIILTGLGLALLVVGLLSASVVAVANGSASDTVQPEEAVESEERALELREELEGLDEQPGVDVSPTVFGAIDDDIAQGSALYRENNFEEAKQQYDEAIQQATGALTQGYLDRSEMLLDSSKSYLQDLRDEGYQTADMAVLAQRTQRLEQRMQSVDSLGDARDLHGDLETLHNDVESDTPSKRTVTVVSTLSSIHGVVLVGLAMALLVAIGGLVGVKIDRRRRDKESTEETTRKAVSDSSGGGTPQSTGRGNDPNHVEFEVED